MACSEEYNITQEQTKMLIEAKDNMISACEDYIRYRLNGDDDEYNNQILSNKLQEKNKKEKILYDLITEISNRQMLVMVILLISGDIIPLLLIMN